MTPETIVRLAEEAGGVCTSLDCMPPSITWTFRPEGLARFAAAVRAAAIDEAAKAGYRPALTQTYPDRDLTPEHTKRNSVDRIINGPTHPDITAAYAYVDSVLDTSDYQGAYAWHGWAIREAFLAGISRGTSAKQEAEVDAIGIGTGWAKDDT